MTTHGNGAGAHMERSGLVGMILGARTEQEISLAEARAAEWLEDNPDDMGIAMACEQLAMMREANRAIMLDLAEEEVWQGPAERHRILRPDQVDELAEARQRDMDYVTDLAQKGDPKQFEKAIAVRRARVLYFDYNEPESLESGGDWGSVFHRRAKENPKLWDASEGWLPYEEAKEYVHAFGFLNYVEWEEYRDRRPFGNRGRTIVPVLPTNIPEFPEQIYEDEWQGWPDWLGYDEALEWRDFEEARDYVHSLGFRDWNEYKLWALPEIEARPRDIPRFPMKAYRDEGWYDKQDWLKGY